MANHIPGGEETKHDRRASRRLPIEQDVRYTVLGGRKMGQYAGWGRTVNISSGGVLFTTEFPLKAGQHIEVAISWPAQIDNEVRLKLVAIGRVVRAETACAAMSIDKYDFKVRGSNL